MRRRLCLDTRRLVLLLLLLAAAGADVSSSPRDSDRDRETADVIVGSAAATAAAASAPSAPLAGRLVVYIGLQLLTNRFIDFPLGAGRTGFGLDHPAS